MILAISINIIFRFDCLITMIFFYFDINTMSIFNDL